METKTKGTSEEVTQNNLTEIKTKIGDKEITIQTGKLAKLANGSITLQCGDTVLLVTAVKSLEPRKDIDFFPLLCDFSRLFASFILFDLVTLRCSALSRY